MISLSSECHCRVISIANSLFLFLYALQMHCKSLSLDSPTKSEVHGRVGVVQHKGLYWGHVQNSGPPSCVGGDGSRARYHGRQKEEEQEKEEEEEEIAIILF